MTEGKVCVSIVTCNSAQYIRRCLQGVLQQEGISPEIIVFDNASSDGTLEILREFSKTIQILHSPRNLGFAEGQNRAIRASSAKWVLTLNPDVLLDPEFIGQLVKAGEIDHGAGIVCGKLLSIGAGFQPLPDKRIDSTGIFFTPSMRHFDRGWHEIDGHGSAGMEYVFGASAAAALFRREMIEDISVDGNFFDPDFFVYREDADVAWRAQLLGWRSIYTPFAMAHHVRTVTPLNRRSVPALLNMHSVKNRFLMRIKNATPGLYRRYWLPMTLRDLTVVGGSILWEPTSLPAFWHLARGLRRALRQRRIIMSRRRVSDVELARWFRFQPVSHPVPQAAPANTEPRWKIATGARTA